MEKTGQNVSQEESRPLSDNADHLGSTCGFFMFVHSVRNFVLISQDSVCYQSVFRLLIATNTSNVINSMYEAVERYLK